MFCSGAKAQTVSLHDSFQLWNDCQTMRLIVERLDEDAADINLSRETIIEAVSSRLTAARLLDDNKSVYVYVRVGVAGNIFSINIDYRKGVEDLATGEVFLTTTWSIAGIGSHGMDAEYILSALPRYLDRFIDEYLRVNADACVN